MKILLLHFMDKAEAGSGSAALFNGPHNLCKFVYSVCKDMREKC
jgi:hypothetical protein